MSEARAEQLRLSRLKHNLELRSSIFELTRAFFRERGFLEVETPVRVPTVAPEAQIVPIRSEEWFLSTSPELYMKRLLAAGYDKIFQVSRCFRKGEQGRLHNPEFSLLEWYSAGSDYNQLISDTEQLVAALATRLKHSLKISYRGQNIDLTPPWPRVTVRDAFLRWAGWDPIAVSDCLRFDTDLVEKVIPNFAAGRPTVIMNYPDPMASLARLKRGDSSVAERMEIFIGGLELCNGYSELTDKREQEERFRKEAAQIKQERGEEMPVPHRFLDAVAYMPECAGNALGMDRLVMLLADAVSIDEVMPFTVDRAEA